MAFTLPGHCLTQAKSMAVESAPPLKATTRGSGGLKCWNERDAGKGAASQALSVAFGFGVVESAITLQPFVTPVQKFFDLEVAHLAPGVVEAALEVRGHLFGVAMEIGRAHV